MASTNSSSNKVVQFTGKQQRTPETPQQQYARALARAQAQGLRVVGTAFQIVHLPEGSRKLPAFYVPSVSEPGYRHCVVQLPDRLACDCMAAQAGRYCMHRAVVHSYLVAQLTPSERSAA